MEENFSQDSKTSPLALVTGASSGIGYELAKVFAQNGFDLIVVAEDQGIAEAAQAFQSMGVDVTPVRQDLSTYEGIESFYEKIRGMDIDVAALNAGVGVGGHFIDTDLQKELKMMHLNMDSTVHLTKLLLKDFVDKKEGHILFTSSIAAEMPGPYYAVYAATKAFVQSFSEALSLELQEHNITVTALQPGATDTNFFARADMLNTKVGKAKKDSPADVAQHGFDALMEGKDHIVAGSFANKVQSTIAKFISEKMGAKMQGKQAKPLNH